MSTENLVRLLLYQDLHAAFLIIVRLGSRVGEERISANLVLYPSCLEFLLCLADPCNFRVGIDHGWDGVVIDVSVTGLDVLCCGNAYDLRRGIEHKECT